MNEKRYRNFNELLDEYLKDPRFAAEFLSEALEQEDFETFLLSLRDVIRVHGTITTIAEKAALSRTTLYKLFAQGANPQLRTILSLLHSLGYELQVVKKAEQAA